MEVSYSRQQFSSPELTISTALRFATSRPAGLSIPWNPTCRNFRSKLIWGIDVAAAAEAFGLGRLEVYLADSKVRQGSTPRRRLLTMH